MSDVGQNTKIKDIADSSNAPGPIEDIKFKLNLNCFVAKWVLLNCCD